MKFLILLSLLLNFSVFEVHGKFNVAYQWKSFNFHNLPRDVNYNFTHSVPFGVARHKDRMFVGLARRNTGIPVTLAYFYLNSQVQAQSPPLIPYPTMLVNTVNVS